ncbi:MFS transporter [Aromatoleum toluclasticum]|uniref:MFS transporter n=1 Tax=Aromatoleum toluclasticum TaxID=92003 RepID=UPI00036CC1E3|nr:MFS transporter [Aromatoleum toluclasticum]
MGIRIVVALALLNQIAFKGSKMLVALHAIELGARPFSLGLLISAYACVPLLLSVHAGRVSDRFGACRPMIAGSFGTSAGLLLPVAMPTLPALYASATLIGIANVYFHVAAHKLVGSLGDGAKRTHNFGLFSLGAAVSAFVAPLVVGGAIDARGHIAAYLLLAAVCVLPGFLLLRRERGLATPPAAREAVGTGGVFALLADADLRRTYVVSGLVLTGVELFGFYAPVYGKSLGFSASAIGVLLATQAAAAFVVRLWMPQLAGRFGEEPVLAASLLVAGATYLLFPLFDDLAMLVAIAFVLGLGLGCGQPLSVVLTYNRSPAGRAGEALGLRVTVNKATQIVIPVAFGSLGAATGVLPVFWGSAALLLLGGWLCARGGGGRANECRKSSGI